MVFVLIALRFFFFLYLCYFLNANTPSFFHFPGLGCGIVSSAGRFLKRRMGGDGGAGGGVIWGCVTNVVLLMWRVRYGLPLFSPLFRFPVSFYCGGAVDVFFFFVLQCLFSLVVLLMWRVWYGLTRIR